MNFDGQYEIITGPLPPLEAADAVVFTRETIINIAAKHGLHATFSPRVYSNSCNLSIFFPGVNLLNYAGHRRYCSAYTHICSSHISAPCKGTCCKSKHKQEDNHDPSPAIIPTVSSLKASFQYRI